jgi:hypothetical protein
MLAGFWENHGVAETVRTVSPGEPEDLSVLAGLLSRLGLGCVIDVIIFSSVHADPRYLASRAEATED